MDPRWLGFSIVTLGIGVYIGSLIGLWVRNNRDERRWRREFEEAR